VRRFNGILEVLKMMRINRRTDYAIRVMLALARQADDTRLPTNTIQEMMLIPRAFLLRIIAELSKAELIETFPGPKGGVQLARRAENINLRDVWEAIEGPFLISDCLEKPEDCPLNPNCPVNAHWAYLQKIFLDELEATNLKYLAAEEISTVAI
jgi:Rrf2 family iron-sulfur cluster assembly transcriptional regulator